MPSPRPKVPPYLLMLVVSFALLGLIGYQTLKDRKISSDLLNEKDSTIQKLEERLQKEKKKATDLQERLTRLSSQKEELNGLREGLSGQLIEMGRMKSLTEEGKKKLESSLLEKQDEVKDLKEKLTLCGEKEKELKLLRKQIARKDTDIDDLKAQVKAVGGHLNAKLDSELAKVNGSVDEVEDSADEVEEKHEKKEIGKKDSNAGEGIAGREKGASEVEEDTEDLKGEETTHEHNEQHTDVPKKTSGMESTDNEDEESRVDDRSSEDASEEVDTEKTHEEEETDEQPDVDMDIVNKADLDENEMAAME